MVGTYFDSSVLVKTYCPEPDSPTAVGLLNTEGSPLPLTHLQDLEIRNAIRLKLFRKEMPLAGAEGALRNFDNDVGMGLFLRPVYSFQAIYRRAEILSAGHSGVTGARTLDILHIAAALEIGSRRFVSFDQRQRAVAKKAGLKVAP